MIAIISTLDYRMAVCWCLTSATWHSLWRPWPMTRGHDRRSSLSSIYLQCQAAVSGGLAPSVGSFSWWAFCVHNLLTGTWNESLHVAHAPCGLQGLVCPWFKFWFSALYVYILFACLCCMLPHLPCILFSSLFLYLSPPLPIFSYENIPAAFPGRMS